MHVVRDYFNFLKFKYRAYIIHMRHTYKYLYIHKHLRTYGLEFIDLK